MLEKFIKYQSLGNDFIILDLYKKPEFYIQSLLTSSELKTFTINFCKRHFGIGADGILIITENHSLNLPEVLIFNANGGKAELCLNGLRCAADYLFKNYKFEKEFKIKMGKKIIACQINDSQIITKIESPVEKIKIEKIKINSKIFVGHVVHMPNPHFIIFEKISQKDLLEFVPQIENHSIFPNKTNVEFAWQETAEKYQMLIFERGVGLTLSCGSGASALLFTLFEQNKIKQNQKITILMPGGNLICWIDNQNQIFLQAQANYVFQGQI